MTQAVTPRRNPRVTTATSPVRAPRYTVMAECLRIQSDAAPRGRAARFFGANPLLPEARNWYAGAVGEKTVADTLEGLGAGWTVLHDVPVGPRNVDIDHVVIGPAGVFAISARNHPGRRVAAAGQSFTVGGIKTDHIRSSLSGARRASKLLALAMADLVPVVPLIVVVGAESVTSGETAPAVTVISEGELDHWLTSRKVTLSAAQVAQLAAAANDRATWHARPAAVDETLRTVQRFERLQAEVDAAHQRRATWSRFAALSVIVLSTVAVFGAAAVLSGGL